MSEPRIVEGADRLALQIGVVVAVSTYAFDSLAISTAMPAISRDLGGVSLYGAAFSSFMLANLFSLAVAGTLADRRGPRPVLTVGLIAFAAGLVVGGTAPTMSIVVLGRAIQGLGAGTIGATVYVIIGRAFAPEDRPRMFALASAAWIVPSLIGPGLAGLVTEHTTWRVVFLGLLPFPGLAGLLTVRRLGHLGPPETHGEPVRPLAETARRAAALAVGVALLVTGLGRAQPVLAGVLVTVGAVLAGPALVALLPKGTWRATPVLGALVAARLWLNWAFFGADAFLPLGITSVRGRGAFLAGLALTASSLSWSAAAWIQSRTSARLSTRTMIGSGAMLVGAGTVVVAVALGQGIPIGTFFFGWMLAGAGMGLAYNASSVAALAEAVPGTEGATSSALQLADALGVALSTGLGGAVVAAGARGGWDVRATLVGVFILTGAAVVPCVAAARRLSGRPAPAPIAP